MSCHFCFVLDTTYGIKYQSRTQAAGQKTTGLIRRLLKRNSSDAPLPLPNKYITIAGNHADKPFPMPSEGEAQEDSDDDGGAFPIERIDTDSMGHRNKMIMTKYGVKAPVGKSFDTNGTR